MILDALVRLLTSMVLDGWTYYFLIAGVIIWIVGKIVERWENRK